VQSSKLTQNLSFGLDIHTGSGDDLQTGCLEARRIRNETNRLDRHGWEWNNIKSAVVERPTLTDTICVRVLPTQGRREARAKRERN